MKARKELQAGPSGPAVPRRHWVGPEGPTYVAKERERNNFPNWTKL